jgi:ABC-type branched-subunit amino acid transport system substrate-binding protein
MQRRAFLSSAAAAALLSTTGLTARAADGEGEAPLRLGMSTPLTGTAGVYGRQLRSGIEACFAKVNAAGGVHGRRLELVALDDGYEPAVAVRNTLRLIEQEKVFALMGYYGTASSKEVLPVIERAGVPLVGTVSGAAVLRGPDNQHLFHLRASYDDETAAIVRNLTTVGLTRVAVFYQDDGFGLAGLNGVKAALAQQGLQPVAVGRVPRNSSDVAAAVAAIKPSNAQAVVMVALASPAAAFVRAMRVGDTGAFFVALSPVGTDQLIQQLGPDIARGIQVAQVIPNPRVDKLGVVREYKATLARYDAHEPASYYGLEGFMAAKLMVAALERAGRNPTREGVTQALRGSTFDLGGYRVQYAQAGNLGSNYVEISVVGAEGRILN